LVVAIAQADRAEEVMGMQIWNECFLSIERHRRSVLRCLHPCQWFDADVEGALPAAAPLTSVSRIASTTWWSGLDDTGRDPCCGNYSSHLSLLGGLEVARLAP
jgi:hypothetical protein